jgi:formamidopyrimidine-DNA glycosylase
MPEIVEVRTDADQLDLYLSGRTLLDVSFVSDLFNKQCTGIEELKAALPLEIVKVRSKAKKLFFYLEAESGLNWWIFISYAMTGRISQTKHKHAHIEFKLDHSWLGFDTFYYIDVRRIGHIEATSDSERYDYHVDDMAQQVVLGYDEFGFNPIKQLQFIDAVNECGRTALVAKIMDQRSICSGVGNWILSEVIYEAELDPFVKCSDLSEQQINNLWKALHTVILAAYHAGGVSMSDYVHIDDTLGEHEKSLKVYGREGQQDEYGNAIFATKGPHNRTIYYIENQLSEASKEMLSKRKAK